MQQDYLRSVMFGAQDGIVSTAGAIAGVAAGTDDHRTVVLAGVVVLIVESLSMGAGQLLSERAVHQLDPTHRDSLVVGALLMGAAYVAGGLVPLVPVVVVRSSSAVVAGTALAFVALFALGAAKGRALHLPWVRSGVEILVVAGVACAAGIAAGLVVGV